MSISRETSCPERGARRFHESDARSWKNIWAWGMNRHSTRGLPCGQVRRCAMGRTRAGRCPGGSNGPVRGGCARGVVAARRSWSAAGLRRAHRACAGGHQGGRADQAGHRAPYLAGIMNLRGRVDPLVRLGCCRRSGRGSDEERFIIVCRRPGGCIWPYGRRPCGHAPGPRGIRSVGDRDADGWVAVSGGTAQHEAADQDLSIDSLFQKVLKS